MNPSAAIEQHISHVIGREDITGLTVLVSRDGRPIYSESFGEKSPGDSVGADPQTTYAIASLTKQFTAALLLMLTAESRVDPDANVTGYFPEFTFDPELRVHHLVSQTSGLVGYTELEDFDILRERDVSPADVIVSIRDQPAAFRPGTAWQYSNTNYVLLAMLLEKLADRPYQDLLQQRILTPLGLSRTGCTGFASSDENSASGSTSYACGPLEPAVPWAPVWTFGTGNIFSSAADLAAWNSALLTSRLLPAGGFSRMTRSARTLNGDDTHYGWGFGVWDVDGIREIRHTGGLPGFSSVSALYPELGIDIIALANIDGLDLQASIVRPILAILTGRAVDASPVPPDISGDALLQSWLSAARTGDAGRLRLSPSFTRFLTTERAEHFRDVVRSIDFDRARVVKRSYRKPVASYEFATTYDGRDVLASVAITDDGTTRFLDVRPFGTTAARPGRRLRGL